MSEAAELPLFFPKGVTLPSACCFNLAPSRFARVASTISENERLRGSERGCRGCAAGGGGGGGGGGTRDLGLREITCEPFFDEEEEGEGGAENKENEEDDDENDDDDEENENEDEEEDEDASNSAAKWRRNRNKRKRFDEDYLAKIHKKREWEQKR